MSKVRIVSITVILSLFSLISSGLYAGTDSYRNYPKKDKLELSADGPYIIYQQKGARIVTVNAAGEVKDSVYSKVPASFLVTDHKGNYPFDVKLHAFHREPAKQQRSGKVFVMSDPHGKLDCVISLLQGNKVIDDKNKWCFGKNHLVVIGDVFDRGKDAIQILWLFYKLEEEARLCGGRLTFMLGNHETMVCVNDLRYSKSKYINLADRLKMKYADLIGSNSELGRWLLSKNTVQIIGDDFYVHAGLSSDFYNRNMPLDETNRLVSENLYNKNRKTDIGVTSFLYGNSGPLWYRGLVSKGDKYKPMADECLDKILVRYKVKHIIVGHTIFQDVSLFYNGKVIDVNVENEKNRKHQLGRGILIEGGNYYLVGDNGIIRKLF